MDLNIVVLGGRLAAEPEVRQFDTGSRLVRYLVTVRSVTPRRRVDVIPVTQWEPADETPTDPGARGRRVWVTGAVQRRFWDAAQGRRSRIELVAHHVELRPDEAPGNGDDPG